MLHTEEALATIDAAWFTDAGQLIVQSGEKIAQVDDRDLVQCLPMLRMDGAPIDDAALLAWIDGVGGQALTLEHRTKSIPVGRIKTGKMVDRFQFVRTPRPDAPAGSV